MYEVLVMNEAEVSKCGWLIYTSSGLKTHLRFPMQLQPAADWLVYQTEAVCAKTVSWGVVPKLCLLYYYISPFTLSVVLWVN